jgi:hypothetical protein
MTNSKVSRKAPRIVAAAENAAASEAPLIPNPPPIPPKPTRKRSPAAAKVALSEDATVVLATTDVEEAPTRKVAEHADQTEPKAAKPVKAKKEKLVRDSFTMPASEYAAIGSLKKRCLNLGVAARKSDILRAAIATFAQLNDVDAAAAIENLEVIKTGRPAKSATLK